MLTRWSEAATMQADGRGVASLITGIRMNVLIAEEFSGIVREEFRKLGHNAYSCDIEDTEIESSFHLKGDIKNYINGIDGIKWDLMICHPPCTHLAVSGARHFHKKQELQREALEFVKLHLDCDIERIALENPISIISSHIRKSDQIIQPWQYGHLESKSTCLWLKNLPRLKPTKIVRSNYVNPKHDPNYKPGQLGFVNDSVWREPPGPNRQKNRSRTFIGIAKAFAMQWGGLCPIEKEKELEVVR